MIMKFSRLKCNLTGFNNPSFTCFYSTNTKYVNQAVGGKSNFQKDFSQSHIETNAFQKLLLGIGSGFMSITDPRRGDMVAVMSESTGALAFEYIRHKMMQSNEGRKILEEKPRISSGSVDLNKLMEMPEGSLGKAYSNFLERYKYSPDSRLAVRFIDDMELAYVAQRYREAHDLFHTLLDMPTNMLGEVTVKWVEAIQTRLPMCVSGALFGPLRLKPKLYRNYSTKAVMEIDSKVAESGNDKMFKKHPGKISLKTQSIPKNIEDAIKSILTEKKLMKQCINESDRFGKRIYNTEMPVEGGLKDTLKILSIQNKLKLKALTKKPDICETDLEKKILNETNQVVQLHNAKHSGMTLNRKECFTYLLSRAPYEYAALLQVFWEIKVKDPEFQPRSLCDFGSGVGTVTWAAKKYWEPSLSEFLTVDPNQDMNDLAFSILKNLQENSKINHVRGLYQQQFLPASNMDYDIVVCAFTLVGLTNFKSRLEAMRQLFNKTSQYLVFVENGTSNGFNAINEAREAILEMAKVQNFKVHVFAPCPHDLTCPVSSVSHRSRCNFISNFNFLSFHKSDPSKVPFSYLILKRGIRDIDQCQWPRVIKEVQRKRKCVFCTFCTKYGEVREVTFTKNKQSKELRAFARHLKLGDSFPGDITMLEDETGSQSNTNCEIEDIDASDSDSKKQ